MNPAAHQGLTRNSPWTSTLVVPAHSAYDPASLYSTDLQPHTQPLLSGQRILVTGGGTGIGGGLVVESLRHGATVIAACFGLEPHVEDAVRRIEGGSNRCELIECDLRDAQKTQEFAASRLGGVDVVLLNAGITLSAPFLSTSPDHARQLFEVNFHSAFLLAQTACAEMLKRPASSDLGRRGQIVFFSSPHALGAAGCHSAYAASKLALEGLASQIAVESNKEGWGIKVNTVRPGWVLTEEQIRVKERDMHGASREEIMDAFRHDAQSFPGYAIFTPRDFADALIRRVAIPGMHDHGAIWDLSGAQSCVFPGGTVIAASDCPTFGKKFLS